MILFKKLSKHPSFRE